MEILSTESNDEAPELVTNFEVLQLLSSHKPKKKSHPQSHVDWIKDHVQSYLKTTPCASIKKDKLPPLIQQLQHEFCLTSAETLQIVNFMPRESVELFLIIKDLPSRLSEKRQEELLALIASCTHDSKQKDTASKEAVMENGDASVMLQEKEQNDVVVKTEEPS
jgi:hypothetical protein